MPFEGTLDALELRDVLRLLEATGKTGCLFFEGDHGSGIVWVDGGELLAASADGLPPTAAPEEVIFELLRSERGTFRFVIDDPPDAEGRGPLDVSQVLEQADLLLAEWRDLEAVVPSSSRRVVLNHEIGGGQVTVDARHWPALVAVASGGTVAEVGATLGLGELAVARMMRDLVVLGVAIIEQSGVRTGRSATVRRRTSVEPTATSAARGRRWVSQAQP